jgi:hypothetical protein
MNKKLIALITAAAFVLFEAGCTVHQVVREPVEALAGKKDVTVIGLYLKSGQEIKFPEKRPGRLFGGQVRGPRWVTREFAASEIASLNRDERQNIIGITTKAGEQFVRNDDNGGLIRQEMDGRVHLGYWDGTDTAIPIDECDFLWVRKVDGWGSMLVTLGGIGLAFLGVVGIIALTKESCPFIYSFDGHEYVFDAEPYGGATSRGLLRTEWCRLEHLRAVDGLYRLRLTNEVDETQHTDELRLVVVDHPAGTGLAADEQGGLHTYSSPRTPLSARDSDGRDLLPFVRTSDWLSWQSRLDDKDPSRAADLRDELIFEFPRPEGARQAKLLFHGGTTLWGSQMLKRFLELYGGEVGRHYQAVDGPGPARAALDAWNLREELYRLWIRVETPSGWKTCGTIVGGGPFMTENRAYPIDLAGVAGDTLRIKLTPPAGFWTINSLAVDYSADQPVRALEIEAAAATGFHGEDIRDLLANTDSRDYAAPDMGDKADLTFLAPPEAPGRARTILAKVSGYYDIHLKAQGEPRRDILTRLSTEPGFPARFALGEYRRWAESLSGRR